MTLPLLPSGPGGVCDPFVAVPAIGGNLMQSASSWSSVTETVAAPVPIAGAGAPNHLNWNSGERVGFEPTVPFGGTHDFQSCTFGHSVTSLPGEGFSYGSSTCLRILAEREGFEPPVPVKVRLISSQVPSTTRPSLQIFFDSLLPRFHPLRRDSLRRSRKNSERTAPHSASRTPLVTSMR